MKIEEYRPAARQQRLDFTTADAVKTLRHGKINLETAQAARDRRQGKSGDAEVDLNVVVASNAIRAAEKAQKTVLHAMNDQTRVKVSSTASQPLICSHSQRRISQHLAARGHSVLTPEQAELMDTGLGGGQKSYIVAEYGEIDDKVYSSARADQLLSIAEGAVAAVESMIAAEERRTTLVTIVDRVYTEFKNQ